LKHDALPTIKVVRLDESLNHGMMVDRFIYLFINLIAQYSRYDKSAVYFGSSGRNGKNFEP